MISDLDIALRGERAIAWLRAHGATLLSAEGEVKIFADFASSPTVVIGRIWFSPMAVKVPIVQRADTDLVFISFAMRGTSHLVGQNETEGATPPPFFVHNTTDPILVETSEASTRLLFGIRRSKVEAVLGPDDNYTGPRIPNAHLRKVLTSATMASLDGSIDGDSPAFPAWRTAIESLVIAVLRSSMRRTGAQGAAASLLARAQTIIDEQAHNPDFSVVDLGQQLGISQSHLHRVFRETGTTPARLLREARIALAEDFLGPGTPTAQDLKAAAALSGFRNMRMFRRAVAEETSRADGESLPSGSLAPQRMSGELTKPADSMPEPSA